MRCVQVLLIAGAWLLAGQPAGAVPALTDLAEVHQQVDLGELDAARNTLRRLRDAEFPGATLSAETCREQPAFALLVAAERQLAARETERAKDYLRQLQCLAAVTAANAPPKMQWRHLRDLLSDHPVRVFACPAPLGEAELARGEAALRSGDTNQAWDALLHAACTLGLAHPRIERLRAALDPPRESAAATSPEWDTKSTSAGRLPPVLPVPLPAPTPLPTPRPPRPTAADTPGPSGEAAEMPAGAPPESGTEPAEAAPDTPAGDTLRDLIERQKTPGEIAFNPPASMRVDRPELIEVRIQPERVDTLGMLGGGAPQVEAISVTPSMSVRLCCGPPAEDHPFDIVAQSSERQLVTADGFTQWVFNVTPRKAGTHPLTLSVASQYRMPDGEVIAKDFPVLTREIRVEVAGKHAPPSRLIALGGALAGLIAAMAAWLAWRRRRRGTRIFISYRRADAGGWVRTLNDRLAARFGDENVFMDVQDIAPGTDFVTALNDSLKDTRVVLIVIGPQWLDLRDGAGRRRLDDPQDWVRLEVKGALDSGKRVIPLLVGGAEMPAPDTLPDDLKPLARRQAVKLHADQYDASIATLIRAIEGHG